MAIFPESTNQRPGKMTSYLSQKDELTTLVRKVTYCVEVRLMIYNMAITDEGVEARTILYHSRQNTYFQLTKTLVLFPRVCVEVLKLEIVFRQVMMDI